MGGLKFGEGCKYVEAGGSHPSRGGWIEIPLIYLVRSAYPRPTPHGVGGLKYFDMLMCMLYHSPTPHGVGGLKCRRQRIKLLELVASHPSRGGWIEIKEVLKHD